SSWFCDGCTATTVLVIMRPFRPRHTGADQAAYTLTATVPDSPGRTLDLRRRRAPGLRRC
ncbi:hypothetical protein OSH41_26435, partial [Mycobacterium ulcerans]